MTAADTGPDSAADSAAESVGEFRCNGIAQVTSGSFGLTDSRWATDVKGKPDPRSGSSNPLHRPPHRLGEGNPTI